MKKSVILITVLMLIEISFSYAEETPAWIKNAKAWEETQENDTFVYAVGVSNYRDGMNDVDFAKNFQQALNESVKKMKEHLQVKKICDYQVIETWYQVPNMYILGAVPKSVGKAALSPQSSPPPPPPSAPPPPPPTSARIEESSVITTEQIMQASDSLGIKSRNVIPAEWWVFYEGPATPLQNVFRVNDTLYAIGKGLVDPKVASAQQWIGARRAAEADAQRYLVAALTGVVTNIRGNGDYTNFIRGIVIGAQQVNVPPIENPHYDRDQATVYILFKVPLNKI